PSGTSQQFRRGQLVVPVDLPVGPGLAGGAVLARDVVLTPADLGLRAGEPVRARGGHLGPRAGLRDSVGGAGAPGSLVPLALAGPDVVQAGELGRLTPAPAVRRQLEVGVGLPEGIGGPQRRAGR